MTIEEIQDRIEEIANVADDGDDQLANESEDAFYLEFIQFVATISDAKQAVDLAAKAALVASTQEINFARQAI